MQKITKQDIIEISNNCNKSINKELDEIYQGYNGQPGTLDDAIYYRFFYRLAEKFPGLNFVELGCKHGNASRFFLEGGGKAALGIDIEDRVKWNLFEKHPRFKFLNNSANSKEALYEGLKFHADVVFLDTSHLYKETQEEFESWNALISDGSLIFFDDVHRYKYVPQEANSYGCGLFFNQLSNLEPDNCINLEHLHLGYGFGAYLKG